MYVEADTQGGGFKQCLPWRDQIARNEREAAAKIIEVTPPPPSPPLEFATAIAGQGRANGICPVRLQEAGGCIDPEVSLRAVGKLESLDRQGHRAGQELCGEADRDGDADVRAQMKEKKSTLEFQSVYLHFVLVRV